MSEEKRFDLELTEQLADFDMTALPEEEQVEPTPWQHLANKLVWGVILSTITLNFLYLDVILPAIGIILLVQAFRPLRKENGWLGLCHGLAWTLCAVRLTGFALQGTLLPESALCSFCCSRAEIRELVRTRGRTYFFVSKRSYISLVERPTFGVPITQKHTGIIGNTSSVVPVPVASAQSYFSSIKGTSEPSPSASSCFSLSLIIPRSF